jgi:hypothetical protein
MSTLSINGVPYSDTKAFMLEVHRVVEGDWDRVESALFDLIDDVPVLDSESIPSWSAIRVPKYGSTHRVSVRASKDVK